MKIFALRNCDACKRAIGELRQNGLDPEIIDVRADGVSGDEIARFLAVFGERLVNRRSTTWRGLSADQKNLDSGRLLAQYPTLMKRPLILDDQGAMTLGWDDQTRQKMLGSLRTE